jgi:predicted lipoprotein with Yx(FWY)xxD motif
VAQFRKTVFVPTAAALVILAGACGSSKKASAPATTAPPVSAPAATTPTTTAPPTGNSLTSIGPATADGLTVSLARGPQGIFLIGSNGHSLYVFDSDHGTTSACTGTCAGTWPGLADATAITAGKVINTVQLGKAAGQVANQVTYYGHLLYEFAGDQAPGQTNGTTIPGWHLLGPFGNVMLPRA